MNERRLFLEDLEATDERHVRKKLVLDEYKGWRANVAQNWLDERKAKRASRWIWLPIAGPILGGAITVAGRALGLF